MTLDKPAVHYGLIQQVSRWVNRSEDPPGKNRRCRWVIAALDPPYNFSLMSDINPYASPANSDDDIPVMDVEVVFERPTLFRDEKLLVMQRNSALPDRCIKSNEPAYGRRLKRSLSWHHPAIFLAVLVSPMIYIILALVLRKQATIYVGLSEEWFRKRRMAIFWGWSIALSGLAMMIAAIAIIGDPHNQDGLGRSGDSLGNLDDALRRHLRPRRGRGWLRRRRSTSVTSGSKAFIPITSRNCPTGRMFNVENKTNITIDRVPLLACPAVLHFSRVSHCWTSQQWHPRFVRASK